MIIKARFRGAEGSLGYSRGRVYRLRITSSEKFPIIIRNTGLLPIGYCPYASQDAFERNWEIVTDQ